jgi:hypothetical protein
MRRRTPPTSFLRYLRQPFPHLRELSVVDPATVRTKLRNAACPLWVKRVSLTMRRSLPVFTYEQTSSGRPEWSVLCQFCCCPIRDKAMAVGPQPNNRAIRVNQGTWAATPLAHRSIHLAPSLNYWLRLVFFEARCQLTRRTRVKRRRS